MISPLILAPLLLVAADTGVTRLRTAIEPIDVAAPDKWVAEDKLRHFAYSYTITTMTSATARVVTGRNESVAIGAAVGVIAGIGKEIYDSRRRGGASFRDLVWDLAGVAVGVYVAQQVR
jgi:uncharacterized protein YfiM (DUF2279 family)